MRCLLGVFRVVRQPISISQGNKIQGKYFQLCHIDFFTKHRLFVRKRLSTKSFQCKAINAHA